MQTLCLLLILVPAPRTEPAPVNPLVGAWSFQWNEYVHQTTFLYADGTCFSPQFGAGKWSHSEDGSIWFSERNDASRYVMIVDQFTGDGTGWSVDADTGEVRNAVNVGMMRRGELLPMPREVQ